MIHENVRKKLLYRSSHRGTKEADILVGAFVTSIIAEISDNDLALLEKFLELKDQDLIAWYFKKQPLTEAIGNKFLKDFLAFKL